MAQRKSTDVTISDRDIMRSMDEDLNFPLPPIVRFVFIYCRQNNQYKNILNKNHQYIFYKSILQIFVKTKDLLDSLYRAFELLLF